MIEITSNRPNSVIVDITLHTVCNFSCSYCSPDAHDGKFRWIDDIDPYINFLKYLKTKNPNIHVLLLGGEPTMWPKLSELLSEIGKLGISMHISTNASRTVRYWEELDTSMCDIAMSWHSEEIDDDHYFNVAKTLQHKSHVSTLLLVKPELFERARVLVERLSTLEVDVIGKKVQVRLDKSEFMPYTPEQLQQLDTWSKIRKNRVSRKYWFFPDYLLVNGKYTTHNRYQEMNLDVSGFYCNAGITRFVVTTNGNIQRCAQTTDLVGNIFGTYEIYSEPKQCWSKTCICKPDALTRKSSHPF